MYENRGFTLIELMIVVTFLGVLAVFAIPQYQSYTSRARWAELIATTKWIRLAVSECLQNNSGALDRCDTLDKIGVNSIPDYEYGAVSFSAGNAAVVISGRSAVSGCTVTMLPVISAGSISWSSLNSGQVSGRSCGKAQTGVGA